MNNFIATRNMLLGCFWVQSARLAAGLYVDERMDKVTKSGEWFYV